MRNLLIVLSILLTACAVPYGERGFLGIGYSEAQIEPGVFFVEYTGDPNEGMAKVVGFWHQRAKELCLHGYRVLEQQQGATPIQTLSPWSQYPRYTGTIRCTDK